MKERGKISLIFICTGNSCRSQMAEGFVHCRVGKLINVCSAGSHPTDEVNPLALKVMNEIGIDISSQYPKSLDSLADENYDWVITLCDYAKDFCPDFKGEDQKTKKLHWPVKDPYRASSDPEIELKAYRDARDDIAARITQWLQDESGLKINLI